MFILAALILAGFAGILLQRSQAGQKSGDIDSPATLSVSNRQYLLEVVSTTQDKISGLSGRSSLPQDRGMLFVYDRESVRCFWMKDMNFPLDIIWLNRNREVVHIERNLSQDTYPKTFCPEQDAMYVIELNANEVERAGIDEGDKLDF